MRHSLLHTVGNVVWAARSERRRALPLLRTYARLKLSEAAAWRIGAGVVSRTRILDLDVDFFDHYWLVEMYEEIFLRGHYFFRAEGPRPVVLDVGSNIGLSILYFKKLYPGARITGFEPDPQSFDVLTRNVHVNGLEDVTLVNAAVHDGRRSVELNVSVQTPGSPQASTSGARAMGRTIVVPAERLSERIAEEVDLLKLDVEGAELAVLDELEGSGKLPLVRRLSMEYHHHLDPELDELSEVLSVLERNGLGYQVEARLDARGKGTSRLYQNVLVQAYRKEIRGDDSRRKTPAEGSR